MEINPMPPAKLTPNFCKTAPIPSRDRIIYWDTALTGFGLCVTASGARSFVCQYRANGISRRMAIKGSLPLTTARKQAKAIIGSVAKGGDPLQEKRKASEAQSGTLKAIATQYLDEEKRLRSIKRKQRTFERFIYPSFGKRPIGEIKRSEIVRAMKKIARERGPAAADGAFKLLSRLFNWYAPLDDDFRSPLVRGTWSVTQGKGARRLEDAELRLIWKVASEGKNPFDHLLRLLLVTATRRNEAAHMPRNELIKASYTDEKGKPHAIPAWLIPEARYKGQDGKSAHAHLIPLSPLAQEVLAQIPVLLIDGKPSPWVLTLTGKVPIGGFGQYKAAFDTRLLAEMRKHDPEATVLPRWTIHSLRKTARSLMSRKHLGISEDHAERCLGHVIGGVRGRYDLHDFLPEKRHAFEALAREIKRIVDAEDAKVIPLRGATR